MALRKAQYWLDREEEARLIAEGMSSGEARRTMLNIAAQYARLAQDTKLLEDEGWLTE